MHWRNIRCLCKLKGVVEVVFVDIHVVVVDSFLVDTFVVVDIHVVVVAKTGRES